MFPSVLRRRGSHGRNHRQPYADNTRAERFGADTPPLEPTNYGYIGQTFTAAGDRLQSLDFLINAEGTSDTKYHLLITTVRTDATSFHPDKVIKEIEGFVEPYDLDMTLHKVHVNVKGLGLVAGQTYAFILDSFVVEDGNPDTALLGVSPSDTYAGGFLVALRYTDEPGATRATHFDAMWPVGDVGDDLAFRMVFSDEGNTILGTRKDDTISASKAPKGQDKATDDDDVIYGRKGADKLRGGDGFDTLNGGKDNDALYGGSDGDHLLGGKGRDKLYGGDGEDCYMFDFAMNQKSAGKNFDKIFAFDTTEDTVYLKQSKFKGLSEGALPDADTHITYKKNALYFDDIKFAKFKGDSPSGLDEIHIVVYA